MKIFQDIKEQKAKEQVIIAKAFAEENALHKQASSSKAKNNISGKKPKEDFFVSPKKEETKNVPSIGTKRKTVESQDDPMMDDVYTTAQDDEDMEDIGKTTKELVASPTLPVKQAESRYRPKKMSSRVVAPHIEVDSLIDDMEDEPQATSSSQPSTMKELRTVQETTRDDEGYMGEL